jgi:DNA-binding transcriptional MocR family regulator
VDALGTALARAARRPAVWSRGPVAGLAELRQWFAAQVGGHLRAADMTVCSGGQPALATALRALGRPGEVLLVEAPTYLGAIAAARDAGLRVVPVPADADGVRPDLLADALRHTGSRLFYCQPLHANPHGAVLSPSRRPQVLAALQASNAFLIEDDYARGLDIDGVAPPPLAADDADGHVVYLRSLTKLASPGLRVAVLGARGAAGARLRSARVVDDFFVAGPLQQAAVELVTSPAWARHLRALGPALRARRDALAAALERELPSWGPIPRPCGGLHLWIRLPDHVDDVALTAAAAARDVVIFAGRPWFAAEPSGTHVRLSFGGAPPATLVEGARRLAVAYRAVTA